jgi:hypothetical protein
MKLQLRAVRGGILSEPSVRYRKHRGHGEQGEGGRVAGGGWRGAG